MKIQIQNTINALKAIRPKSTNLRQLKALRTQVDELLDLTLAAHDPTLKSHAQLKQDIFVLLQTGYKTNGFFVEFGATNGITMSNTYLLEKHFGWAGILAEPATLWHEDLSKNRTASIEHDCVWRNTGEELLFNMTKVGEMSTIDAFSDGDAHSKTRSSGDRYIVQTISLNDLLIKHNAPKNIDYLSVDTEGSEFTILSAFDFTSHNIKIITCEHNFTQDRERIQELLLDNGYDRVFENISRFDDWYIRKDQMISPVVDL